jgi:hypothetical protein
MTSHESADVSQYGGRVECAGSDDSASSCGVVTAGGCTTDCDAWALTVAVAKRADATDSLQTSTHRNSAFELSCCFFFFSKCSSELRCSSEFHFCRLW